MIHDQTFLFSAEQPKLMGDRQIPAEERRCKVQTARRYSRHQMRDGAETDVVR